jgi:raffinose/stachyose/melibiose transport system substrate-binding protein
MSKRLMKLLCLIVAFVMLAGLAACGTTANTETPKSEEPKTEETQAAVTETEEPKAEPVTYKVQWAYSTDDEKAPMDWAIAEIKKAMPHVTIEVEPQIYDNGESLQARIATGDLPDIFGIMPKMIDAAVNSKSILQLDDALASTGLADKYTPMALEGQAKYTDGKCWAFPVSGTSVDLLFYNKELFEQNGVKVPANYPEFLEAVKAFNAKGIIPIPIFAKEFWPIGAYFDMFAQRVDPEGMLALCTGKAKASDPGYADAIKKMTELVGAGVFQKGATTFDYDAARSIFESGKAAMLVNGEWEIADATAKLGDKVDFLDIFPTTDPGKEDANKYAMPGASEFGGLAVSAKVKNPDEAKQLAALLAENLGKGSFIKLGRIDMAIKLEGLTPEKPLVPMAQKLMAQKSSYTVKGTVAHSLPNKKFATGFGELLQKMVAGMGADEFIKEADKLYESSK